jgi:hypothetical protein
MTTKPLIVVPVLALLLGIPGSAQSPADLLQKGIYEQETAGNIDAALQIFRQVVNSSDRKVAAQAQYQIVLCLLQQGDRPGATKEVEKLARASKGMKRARSRGATGVFACTATSFAGRPAERA